MRPRKIGLGHSFRRAVAAFLLALSLLTVPRLDGAEILHIDGRGTPDTNGPTPVWPVPGMAGSFNVQPTAVGVSLLSGTDIAFDADGTTKILRQRLGEVLSIRFQAVGQPFTQNPHRQAYGISLRLKARHVGEIAPNISGTCLTLSNTAGQSIRMEMDSRHFLDRRGISLRRPGPSGPNFSPPSESLVQERHTQYEIPAIPLDREMLLEVFATRHPAHGIILIRLNGCTYHVFHSMDSGSSNSQVFDAGNASWRLNLPVIGGVQWEIHPPLVAWDEVHDEPPHWWKDAGPEHELKAVFQPQIMHGLGLGDYEHTTTGSVDVRITAIKGRSFPHQQWLVAEASGTGSHQATTRHVFGHLPFNSEGDASIVLGKDVYAKGAASVEMKVLPDGGGWPLVHLKLDAGYALRDMLNGGSVLYQLHPRSRVTVHAVLSLDGSVRVITTDQSIGSNRQTVFSSHASPWTLQPIGRLQIVGTSAQSGDQFAWGFQSIQSWITLPINSSMVTSLRQSSGETGVEVDYHSGGNIGQFLNFMPSVGSIPGGWYPGLAEGFRREAVTSYTGRSGQRFELWYDNNLLTGGLDHVRGVRLLMMDGCAVNGFNQMTQPHSMTEAQLLVTSHISRLHNIVNLLTSRGNKVHLTTMVPREYLQAHTQQQRYWTCELNAAINEMSNELGLLTVTDLRAEAMQRRAIFPNGSNDLLIGGDGIHPTGTPGRFGGSTGAHDWYMLTHLGERSPDGQSETCIPLPVPVQVTCWMVDCAPAIPDGIISIADVTTTLAHYGQNTSICDNSPNHGDGTFGDGIITIVDVVAVITRYGEVCDD